MNHQKQQQKLAKFLSVLQEKSETATGQFITLREKNSDTTPHEMHNSEMLAADWKSWNIVTDDFAFGTPGGHQWFAGTIIVPVIPAGTRLFLKVHAQNEILLGRTDPQCQIWLDRKLHQAIDGYHREIYLSDDIGAGEKFELHINAYTSENKRQFGFSVEYYFRNQNATRLFYDLNVPFEAAQRLDDNDKRKHTVFAIIDASLKALDLRPGAENFESSILTALIIAQEIYSLVDTDQKATVTCVGHTHIDVAWLWPVCQTREKMIRSMSTAVQLLDRNPDFVFMYNQCILFDWLREDAPDLYARIKQHVSTGAFEVEGAMWLEPDVNIASGESLVRQILWGVRFQQKEFGVTPRILWLPDTFGYSAALPQIMRKSGLDFFVTSKLSWNDTNRMPYDSFVWQGIDGSEVDTFLITTQKDSNPSIRTNYGPDLDVSNVIGAWNRYEPKDLGEEVLVPYGHADGGGGPTQEMIEVIRRMERGVPGLPKVKHEGLVLFANRMREKMANEAKPFPKWVGELYFEFHRGTLTSLAKNKRYNRLAENRMQDVEFLAALNVISGSSSDHSGVEIEKFWRVILLNQFHDILPGSSIGPVYEVTDTEYSVLMLDSQKHMNSRIDSLFGSRDLVAIINSTGFDRHRELLRISAEEIGPLADSIKSIVTEKSSSEVQLSVGADGQNYLISRPEIVEATSATPIVFSPNPETKFQTDLSVSESHLENSQIRISLNDAGEINSIFDKIARREVLKSGTLGNRLVAFQDRPVDWDCWDIDWYFDETYWPIVNVVDIRVVETGPWRAAIEIKRRYQSSEIVQMIALENGASQVEFEFYTDWKESQTLVKVGFDIDINTSEILSEIQFGHVKRPTHFNTSWDRARFEASMHKWVALQESSYAIALLNDSKYGYDVKGQSIRLSLLKSGTYPFDKADQEKHFCRYALYIPDGLDPVPDIVKQATRFSHPLQLSGIGLNGHIGTGQSLAPAKQLFSLDSSSVVVHAIKPAVDGEGIIIRLCEEGNRRCQVRLKFNGAIKSAIHTDLLENSEKSLQVINSKEVSLDLKPFEIVTLRVIPAYAQL